MKIYEFCNNYLSENSFEDLFSRLIGHVPYCSLVVRHANGLNQNGEKFISSLGQYLVKKDTVTSWPGTKLLSEHADFYVYKFNVELLGKLLESERMLYDWIQPDLPEDLCLLRNNFQAYFISIAHEKESYFKLAEDEFPIVNNMFPELLKLR